MSTFVDDTTPLLPANLQADVCIPMTTVTTKSPLMQNTTSTVSSAPKERLASLDQYRGFVILCSIVVPLLGHLKAAPSIFRHNGNFFSIHDATQPLFYMAIGFSMQMSLLQLRAKKGMRGVIIKQFKRSRTLYLIGLVMNAVDDQISWANLSENWYKLPLQFIWGGGLFQTLVTISIAQLIILPVITRSIWLRLCYMIGCISFFTLGEWAFYFKLHWQYRACSFEALSWAFVILAGTFLDDWNKWISVIPTTQVVARRRRVIKASVGILVVAGANWLLGYLISSIPASWSPSCYTKAGMIIPCPNMSLPSIPFVAPQIDVMSIWTMSQWVPSLTIHLVFSFLNTLSTHALLMYILSDAYGRKLASRIVPNNSPLYMLPVVLLIGISTNVLIARFLEANNINLRL